MKKVGPQFEAADRPEVSKLFLAEEVVDLVKVVDQLLQFLVFEGDADAQRIAGGSAGCVHQKALVGQVSRSLNAQPESGQSVADFVTGDRAFAFNLARLE